MGLGFTPWLGNPLPIRVFLFGCLPDPTFAVVVYRRILVTRDVAIAADKGSVSIIRGSGGVDLCGEGIYL